MSDLKNIAGQSFIYLLGTIFTVFVGFFFKIYIARHLGAEGLGIYSLGVSLVTIASVFMTLGLGNGLVRFVSKYSAEKNYIQLHTYLHSTFKINLLSISVFSSLLLFFPDFIASRILKTPEITPYLSYFAILMIVNSFIALFDQIIRGFKEVKKSSVIGNFIRLPFKVLIAIVFITYGFQLNGYLIAEILAALLTLVLFVFLIKRMLPEQIRPLWKNNETDLKKEEKEFGFNFLIVNMMGIIQSEGDKIILAIFFSTTELGIYSIVLTFIAFVPVVLKSVIAILGPFISEKHSLGNDEEMERLFKKTSYFTFLISFSLIFVLAYAGKPLLSIFGEEFLIGYLPMLIMLIGNFFNVATGSVGTFLVMTGNEKLVRNVSVLNFIISIALYWFLIPVIGIYGAALTKTVTLIIINSYLTLKLNSVAKINLFDQKYSLLVAFSVLFLFISVFVAYFFIENYIVVIASTMFFLALYYAILFRFYIDAEDKFQILSIVNHLKIFKTKE